MAKKDKKTKQQETKEQEISENEAAVESGTVDTDAPETVAQDVESSDVAAADADLAALNAKIEELEKSLSEAQDQKLRLQAEFDNFRRRSKQEKDQLYEQSVADVVCSWLPVIDNLDRAMDAISKNSSEGAEELLKGLELVQRQVHDVLEKLGVEEIPALGETFDPEIHSAVLHVEDEAYGSSEIVEVFEPGYRRGDQVLRFSMVKVAN